MWPKVGNMKEADFGSSLALINKYKYTCGTYFRFGQIHPCVPKIL